MSNPPQALPALEEYSFTYLTPQELPLVQTLCEQCAREIEQSTHLQPGLSVEHVLGLPPGPSMAQELALALPAGKGYEDKLLMGIFARTDHLIGVLDVIRDYPVQGEWWLGLLILEPAQRGRGLGEKICRAFEQWAKDTGARYLRLVVSVQNRRGHQFWQRLGFEELERRVRKLSDGQDSEAIIMGQPL
jgi:GNAT superfamily N-acetyltransferase